jgi:recombination protein RecT
MSSTALKAAATGSVSRPQRTIFDYLDDPRVKAGIAAVAGRYLTADRMLKLCINAVKKTPQLMKCDPQTVLGAMMTSAALGLEPNTIQQQAFLIPYKRRAKIGDSWVDVHECQFQVGARGFVTLAYRSPHIKSLAAEAIHDGDKFEHEIGSSTFLRYAKNLRERGALIGSFSHVLMAEGGESVCILPLDEILKIRSKSETYRALVRGVETAESAKDKARAEEKLAETPWVMWEDDMATKSAIKKHAKLLPIASGDALVAAADIDNRSDVSGNTIDMRAMVDPDAVRSVIGDGMSPPAIEHQPAETFDFPVQERREPVAVEQAQAARPPGREASGPAPGPDDEWKPSPAEQARIAALEQAEADGRDSPAPNPSPAPAARRARAAVRSME